MVFSIDLYVERRCEVFEKLTRADLEPFRASGSNPEYAEFVGSLRKGEGGRVVVAKAGVGRQTVKNRLKSAATSVGQEIRFVRSATDEVVFEVVAK